MNTRTKILIVEHDKNDLELLQYELKKGGINYISQVVHTEHDYACALESFIPEIILSDYSLPEFDGPSAYQMKQQRSPETPFIIVSGYLGEETSIEFIKAGITDYVLKDKLFTLAPKVKRALLDAKNKAEKRQAEESLHMSEASLRSIFETTDIGFLLMDTGFNILAINATLNQWSKNIFGHEFYSGMNMKDTMRMHKFRLVDNMMRTIIEYGQVVYENKYAAEDGNFNWFVVSGKSVVNENKEITGACISVHDITARKRAEEKIKELNAHLEDRVLERTNSLNESNKALEAFSYSVSHDLTAPVRVVKGFVKIIMEEYSEKMEPEAIDLFKHVDESSTRMMTIIDDLLKLAKYGKETLKLTTVNMTQLVNQVWSNLSRNNPHQAVLKLTELPVIQADRSMMEQVVINLLSNAIKYSSKTEKPLVTVWSEEKKEKNTFCFKDNGAGFDMKSYDRLFGAFQRLHGMSEFEGTGVGLTLVKNIIEKHGGEVSASGVVNKGATFCFSLPL